MKNINIIEFISDFELVNWLTKIQNVEIIKIDKENVTINVQLCLRLRRITKYIVYYKNVKKYD